MDLDRDFQRLRTRARQLGVHVRFRPRKQFRLNSPGTVASYHPLTRTITLLKKRWGKRDLLYTMAHELGHVLDFDKKSKKKIAFHGKALTLFHLYARKEVQLEPQHKPDFRDYILGLETAAFDEGDRLLEELGISLPWEWRKRERQATLGAYRHLFRRRY